VERWGYSAWAKTFRALRRKWCIKQEIAPQVQRGGKARVGRDPNVARASRAQAAVTCPDAPTHEGLCAEAGACACHAINYTPTTANPGNKSSWAMVRGSPTPGRSDSAVPQTCRIQSASAVQVGHEGRSGWYVGPFPRSSYQLSSNLERCQQRRHYTFTTPGAIPSPVFPSRRHPRRNPLPWLEWRSREGRATAGRATGMARARRPQVERGRAARMTTSLTRVRHFSRCYRPRAMRGGGARRRGGRGRRQTTWMARLLPIVRLGEGSSSSRSSSSSHSSSSSSEDGLPRASDMSISDSNGSRSISSGDLGSISGSGDSDGGGAGAEDVRAAGGEGGSRGGGLPPRERHILESMWSARQGWLRLVVHSCRLSSVCGANT